MDGYAHVFRRCLSTMNLYIFELLESYAVDAHVVIAASIEDAMTLIMATDDFCSWNHAPIQELYRGTAEDLAQFRESYTEYIPRQRQDGSEVTVPLYKGPSSHYYLSAAIAVDASEEPRVVTNVAHSG